MSQSVNVLMGSPRDLLAFWADFRHRLTRTGFKCLFSVIHHQILNDLSTGTQTVKEYRNNKLSLEISLALANFWKSYIWEVPNHLNI